ncbi:MAG TPA: hypothetical protein EYQ14_16315 [Gammaproteobacteria bacterium]|nr:hypothetical protein [Gammaproteobacteria bacterium]HIL95794.1 hypothetical protein [Pseudomonadales bacterium]
MRLLPITILLLLLLTGCGQKGPLYLPAEEPPQAPPESGHAESDQL